MITAEEWLLNHKKLSKYDVESYDEGGYLGVNDEGLYKIMIEFAKLHVQEALKAAWAVEFNTLEEFNNCYPLDNIK